MSSFFRKLSKCDLMTLPLEAGMGFKRGQESESELLNDHFWHVSFAIKRIYFLKLQRIRNILLILQALAVDDGILGQYRPIIGQLHCHAAVIEAAEAIIFGGPLPPRTRPKSLILGIRLSGETGTFITL